MQLKKVVEINKNISQDVSNMSPSELTPLEPFEEIMSYELSAPLERGPSPCEPCEKLNRAIGEFEKAFFVSNKEIRKSEGLSAALDIKQALIDVSEYGYLLLREEIMFVSLIVFWCMEEKKDPHIDDMMKRWQKGKVKGAGEFMCDNSYDENLFYWFGYLIEYIEKVVLYCAPALPEIYKNHLLEIQEVVEAYKDYQEVAYQQMCEAEEEEDYSALCDLDIYSF